MRPFLVTGWSLLAQLAVLQQSSFSSLVRSSCELLCTNLLHNSPFITLLRSSLYCATPSHFSSFLPSQLRNIFYSVTYFSLRRSSLYFMVIFFSSFLFFLIFTSVDCFCVRCLFQLHWTSADLSQFTSRPSKREGYPCKASTFSHLPRWESLFHSTLLTKHHHH